ncbi:PREDICTED: uncharacterized protein LOC109583858 [Amphimedon queenslandica]|uniref:Uncharacterized protein n=1 Tax=Amphimedon queenslandica TaxID=400682 RepID=A0AAN0JDY1_AMPQE|nr:PREDICTED: uncharacterized protein LOC109583858 [Amphimedon queenslandica]|eukprot:XP_019854918.1 PREDICTED: uncharacterized protein LOC109583858 [Amphimedon queenslandica]
MVLKCWVKAPKKFSSEFVTQCVTETLESYSLNGVLNLIGRLSCRVPSYEALLLLITEFCNDINPRLCREAMKALAITNAVTNNGRGYIYTKVYGLLNDDDQSVLYMYMYIKLIHSLGLSGKKDSVHIYSRMTLYMCTCMYM